MYKKISYLGTVDYKTKVLDNSEHTATPGVDYVHKEDTVTFEHN